MESSYLVVYKFAGNMYAKPFDTLREAKLDYEKKIDLGLKTVFVTKVIAEYHG